MKQKGLSEDQIQESGLIQKKIKENMTSELQK